ncbi:phytanoyl-CoA dioxygenase [Aureococcus anophagefferens]|nr:phytanoyl-CoA dioxygenase [Aureococcus anophagefferens]
MMQALQAVRRTSTRRCLSAKPAVGHSGHLSADSLKNQHDAPDLGLAMSHKHKYLFDLNGFLVLRGVFSPEDVAAANDAVDAHADTYHERTGQLRTSGLYGRESHALAGDGARGRLDMGGLLAWDAPHNALTDAPAGAGGFCAVPGSHKANFSIPPALADLADDELAEHVVQPAIMAGDVLLFSEATLHGTLPWTLDHQRRTVIYRFAPAGPRTAAATPEWPAAMLAGMSEAQRAVCAPPYHPRMNRTCLDEEGRVAPKPRGRGRSSSTAVRQPRFGVKLGVGVDLPFRSIFPDP